MCGPLMGGVQTRSKKPRLSTLGLHQTCWDEGWFERIKGKGPVTMSVVVAWSGGAVDTMGR